MKQISFWFLFCCLCFACNCNEQSKQKINSKNTVQSNDVDSVKENLKNKIQIIDSVLAQRKENVELLHKKGQIFLKLGKRDSAIKVFEKVLQIQKKHTPTLLALAYLYAEEGNVKCEKLVGILLYENKNEISMIARGNYILGVYNTVVGNSKKAIIYFDRCIKNNWTFIDAYLEKGILFLKEKKTKEALSIFLLATKVNNKHAESYYWVGRTLEEMKNFKDAKKYYKQALMFDKNLDIAQQRLQKIENKK